MRYSFKNTIRLTFHTDLTVIILLEELVLVFLLHIKALIKTSKTTTIELQSTSELFEIF